MNCRAAERDAGFTLVETVVAFAILSIVVTGSVQIVGAGSVRVRAAAAQATAIADAQAELARLDASANLTRGISSGSFQDGFGWKLTAVPYERSSAVEGSVVPWSVALTVEPPKSSGAGITLRTILLSAEPKDRP